MATSLYSNAPPEQVPGTLNFADAQYQKATDFWKNYADNIAGLSWQDFNDKGMGKQYGYVPGVRGYVGEGAADTPFHDTETGISTIAGKGSYVAGSPSQQYTAQWGQPSRTYASGTAPAGVSSLPNAASPQSAAATTTPTAGGSSGAAGGSGAGVTGTTAGAGVTTGNGSGAVSTGATGAAAGQSAPATAPATQAGRDGVSYLTQIDPSQLTGVGGSGVLSNGQQAMTYDSGYYDEGGYHAGPSGSSSGIAAFTPGLDAPGGQEGIYDTTGKLQQVHDIPAVSGFDKVVDTGVMMGLAAAGGELAMGAMGAGAGASADAATLNPDNAVAGINEGGIDAGGMNPATVGDVNANYSLTSGTSGLQTGAIDGNAGQGLNIGSNSGTGLNMSQSPNMDTMGGGQGLSTNGTQVLGDSSSYINAPENQLPGADKQLVTENGVYSPSNPYQPSLGDPNSYINGGTGGVPAATTPEPGILDKIKGVVGGVNPTDVLKTITAIAPILTSVLGPKAGGGGSGPAYTPTQPAVGAQGYADASAQGGASGSLAGVAGTLLTAKDTFGYGKSMLT